MVERKKQPNDTNTAITMLYKSTHDTFIDNHCYYE